LLLGLLLLFLCALFDTACGRFDHIIDYEAEVNGSKDADGADKDEAELAAQLRVAHEVAEAHQQVQDQQRRVLIEDLKEESSL